MYQVLKNEFQETNMRELLWTILLNIVLYNLFHSKIHRPIRLSMNVMIANTYLRSTPCVIWGQPLLKVSNKKNPEREKIKNKNLMTGL